MNNIRISRETKQSVSDTVRSLGAVDSYFFHFLPADEGFQNELYELALAVGNAKYVNALKARIEVLRKEYEKQWSPPLAQSGATKKRGASKSNSLKAGTTEGLHCVPRAKKAKISYTPKSGLKRIRRFRPAGLPFQYYAEKAGLFIPKKLWVLFVQGGAPGLVQQK